MYSEIPTSDSIRRMTAPFSSWRGGAIPSREWLGGRILAPSSFGASLAEGKVADESGVAAWTFVSAAVSSILIRFNGGASAMLSKGSCDGIVEESATDRGRGLPSLELALRMPAYRRTYADRAKHHVNPAAKSLLETIERKQSNLCVSVDVTSSNDFLSIIDAVGPYVSLIKASLSRSTDAVRDNVQKISDNPEARPMSISSRTSSHRSFFGYRSSALGMIS